MWHCNDCSVDFVAPLELEVEDYVLQSCSVVVHCPRCGSVKIEVYVKGVV